MIALVATPKDGRCGKARYIAPFSIVIEAGTVTAAVLETAVLQHMYRHCKDRLAYAVANKTNTSVTIHNKNGAVISTVQIEEK